MIKRLLCTLLLISPLIAMGQTAATRSSLLSEVDTRLPSGTAALSAANLRLTLKDIIASSHITLTDGSGGGGSGDMLKATYDVNADNIVDVAASANAVSWANVSGKPTTLSGFGITDAQAQTTRLTQLIAVTGTGVIYYMDSTGTPHLLNVGSGLTLNTTTHTISSAAGGGNMNTSTYDTDADGKVDAAALATHTHTASQISDSTVAGRALLTAADAAAQKTALGLVKADVGLGSVVNSDATNASNLSSGTVAVARLPALTGGDATTSAGSGTITLGTSGVSAGSYGSSTLIPVITFDAKGRATSASTVSAAGGGGSGTANVKTITDATLAGLATVGKVIYYTGSAWALAESNAQSTNHFIGVVSAISGSNVTYVTAGEITGLTGLTAGQTYYLSDATAGATVATAPTSLTSYLTPVMIATSTTAANVTPWTGDVGLAATTNADLATMATGTIKSNLTGSTASPSDNTLAAVYGKLVPAINAQVGTSYGLLVADQNKIITMNNASANTVNVPLNATQPFDVGTTIWIQRLGAGSTTLTSTGGVTVNAPGGLAIATQYDYGQLIKRATDTWDFITASSISADALSALGADIASAATTNLETATGNTVDVTGTTGITAITLNAGHKRTVRFTGILTLTHGASLILPTGAPITTTVGDYATFIGYGSGVVRCSDYMRANGNALAGAGGGSVSTVSVTTANGVSGSVANATSTPAITLTLGAITPTTVNGNTITTGTGTLTLGAGKTATFSNTLTFTGTDGSSLNIGTGGALGTAAFTAASAYEVPLTFAGGLTRTSNTITDVPGLQAQTASYSLVLTDQNKVVTMNNASANNLTVPLNATQAFPVGTIIPVIQLGAGATSIVATGGVTINAPNGLKIGATNGSGTLLKLATDTWKFTTDVLHGSATNDSAAAGDIGEVIESKVATGSAITLTTVTAANVTSISLTAGDWQVSGVVDFVTTTATVTLWSGGIGTTTATVPVDGTENYSGLAITTTSTNNGFSIAPQRISLSTTTTVYLVAKSTFTAGTNKAFGHLYAIRTR